MTKMHRSALIFSLASAALTAAQGFASECSDLTITDSWLIATCPTGNGDEITSSVWLPGKIRNNNANLEWITTGRYDQSCQDCVLNGATLDCQCQGSWLPRLQPASINLDEHIANYEGHLLSNQTGAITTIPENSSTPIPSLFDISLYIPTNDYSCADAGFTITSGPAECFFFNYNPIDFFHPRGQTSTNEGYEVVVFPDEQCAGEVIHTFMPGSEGECVEFSPVAQAFSFRPLWNADW
ncbi:Cyanovirin-N [Aspergillus crustosus]